MSLIKNYYKIVNLLLNSFFNKLPQYNDLDVILEYHLLLSHHNRYSLFAILWLFLREIYFLKSQIQLHKHKLYLNYFDPLKSDKHIWKLLKKRILSIPDNSWFVYNNFLIFDDVCLIDFVVLLRQNGAAETWNEMCLRQLTKCPQL